MPSLRHQSPCTGSSEILNVIVILCLLCAVSWCQATAHRGQAHRLLHRHAGYSAHHRYHSHGASAPLLAQAAGRQPRRVPSMSSLTTAGSSDTKLNAKAVRRPRSDSVPAFPRTNRCVVCVSTLVLPALLHHHVECILSSCSQIFVSVICSCKWRDMRVMASLRAVLRGRLGCCGMHTGLPHRAARDVARHIPT